MQSGDDDIDGIDDEDEDEDADASDASDAATSQVRRMLVRSFAINKRTGRKNQVLTCSECGHQFAKMSNGIDHALLHFRQKPHSCHRCGKRFTQQGNRNRHVANQICERRDQRKM